MKNFYNKVSIFSVLALVAFEPQNLQATSSSSEERQDSQKPQKPQKPLTPQSFDLLQNILQKIKDGHYISETFLKNFVNTHLEELKECKITITPNHDLFDNYITLILNAYVLKAFPENFHFDDCLKAAKERGEGEYATPAALNNLGFMYYTAQGVDQDFIKAFEYYEKAADQGHADALNNLGFMYEFGNGVDKDLIKAFECHQKAAEQGHVDSLNNLGYMYFTAQGVDKDLIKAFEYYEKAADQGHAKAQCHLGFMYYHGVGVDEDFNKAVELYQKAADQDHIISQIAQNDLGLIYQEGRLGKKDLAQSLKWYLKSAKNKYTVFDDFKINLKSLVTFVPSMIALKDEKNLTNNQETLKDNIEVFLGLHGFEAGLNNPTSSFKESKFAIPSLFKNYSEIVNFEDVLLKFIPAFDQSGFMVTCLQPNDVEAFKSSNCPDIKCHELEGKSFLTFGQSNVETADKLMMIFDQSHSVYGAMSNILGVLTEIQESFRTGIQLNGLAKDLKNQYESRVKLELENHPSKQTRTLMLNTKLAKKVEQEIKVLTQLQAIPQQLQNLLIEGVPIRNKFFLKNNDYIEPIFKD